MSVLDMSLMNVLFALLLAGLLLGVLYKYGWSRGDGRKRPSAIDILGSRGSDGLGLESYLDERASRRGKF
jgi:hypothetical protein